LAAINRQEKALTWQLMAAKEGWVGRGGAPARRVGEGADGCCGPWCGVTG